MRPAAAGSAERLVQRLAYQRVREADAADGRRLGKHTRGNRFVDRLEHAGGVDVGDGGELAYAELAAEDRRRAQQPAAGGGQAAKSLTDDLANRLRELWKPRL